MSDFTMTRLSRPITEKIALLKNVMEIIELHHNGVQEMEIG